MFEPKKTPTLFDSKKTPSIRRRLIFFPKLQLFNFNYVRYVCKLFSFAFSSPIFLKHPQAAGQKIFGVTVPAQRPQPPSDRSRLSSAVSINRNGLCHRKCFRTTQRP